MADIKIRGRSISRDINGLLCLNDIHSAAGFSKNQTPGDWFRLTTTHQRVNRVLKLNTGKSRNWTKDEMKSTYYMKRGAGGGTYADPRLALDYAEYLNPGLAIEVKEVFLRFKAADPVLADEVLDRASAESNEWAAIRALGRVKRHEYTKTLDNHGVEGFGFGNCTNEVYKALFDATAKKLKEKRSLPASANLRNAMTTDELVFVMAAETLAKQRIEQENPRGNSACAIATSRSSMRIRAAIDEDRHDRQSKLI